MGDAVTIGRLMMASGDMLKGRWESIGALGSGCEDLDDFPRPEVLTLLAGVRRIEVSGCEEVVPGVVGGLRVSYLCWGGLECTPPSKEGMVGASGAWDVESWGEQALGLGSRESEESVWPPLIRAMSQMEWKARVCVLQVWWGSPLQMGGRKASNGEKRWKFGRCKVMEAFAMGRWGVRNENRA